VSANAAKGTIGVVVSVLGWALVYFLVAHSWALYTARESTVGTPGLIGFEVLRIAPTLAYFLAVGLVFASLLGSVEGAKWAALGASVAMAVEALIEHQIFYGGIDLLAVAVLAVDYFLPVVFAVVGAFIARFWQKSRGQTVAT
jgi:hypothetical protein